MDPEELLKFKKLLDAGAISQEEYNFKKNELLGLPTSNKAQVDGAQSLSDSEFIVCDQCKKIAPKEKAFGINGKLYCGTRCSAKAAAGRLAERSDYKQHDQNRSWSPASYANEAKNSKTCPNCNAIFDMYRGHQQQGSTYCSERCASEFKAKGEKQLFGCVTLIFIGLVLYVWQAVNGPPRYSTASSSTQTESTPVPTPSPDTSKRVELVGEWTWKRPEYSNYIYAVGKVKNISGQPLKYLKAVITSKNKSGAVVSVDDNYVEYTSLMPDQTAPFKVMINYNPDIQQGEISFVDTTGKQVYHN